MPIANPEFASNPDPRCACLLLLDTSGSMAGAPIDALNAGLRSFQDTIQEDSLASRRVEIAIVTFGGVVTRVQDFVSAASFTAPVLSCSGGTPMGQAIAEGVQLVKSRKGEYKSNGIAYYRPWIFLITDGAPTDEWQSAAQLVHAEVAAKGLAFFAVGVGEANTQILKSLTDRVLKLDGLKFNDLFLWLSKSQQRVSANKTTEQTALPPVDGFSSPV